jgi:hypothetical protein
VLPGGSGRVLPGGSGRSGMDAVTPPPGGPGHEAPGSITRSGSARTSTESRSGIAGPGPRHGCMLPGIGRALPGTRRGSGAAGRGGWPGGG